MSKITFRADDDLVRRLEEFDSSKSEVMREALRQYLDAADPTPTKKPAAETSLDDLVAARVDALIDERLDALIDEHLRSRAGSGQDVNVNITLDGDGVRARQTPRKTSEPEPLDATDNACVQCGESLDGDHVYCPNCGEKATHRVFCECGDEVRSDWAFCPSCGRRTPAADVLDRS
ncbi:zinc ribbon domain-containing protein [Haladaptatus sp. GCM10025707]|uniref:double zinc ribbon domain-containing protein n=1 Tax=unclassified Haladaptatus TaxID=2622732 RepID=UPI0023E8BEF3|nr:MULTISPECIES: zinc ribbon domain-containing protein [unclassified Haladaptatus]